MTTSLEVVGDEPTNPAPAAAVPSSATHGHWYQNAIIYELHVRSFYDGNGDGIGDFRGLTEKLDYLQGLGVTALWLLPFYPSPLRDDGYDISDYRQVHPAYGTLRDFRTFLRAAHRRGMRVITELVLAHTSDEHPWFQRARRAPAGSTHRDFYTWGDTPERFKEARVIFHDFEASNWTFDPTARAYYWHRFYAHQPSLNYDNPAVRQAMFDVVDYWLAMGVDGLRLDAVPYLYARDGTSCENLPETFEFIRALRGHVDGRFEDRMLLAEANQWPEDAVAYMGGGDMCHMAFHFPLMPRMFMAARQEDRYPIVDILAETPDTPGDCQWALFLRNHDELTLEMVTDEERDYMYRSYAQDPQARVNMGIRRRLAPLLSNDRSLIEMMNGLLFSMPGTPILYYGDEIGMGDNIYLGDRNGVRTPMQWDSDRNAGFSRANPQRLYLPVIIDPEYHFQAVNVSAEQENPSSLLWWMRRLIGLRQRYQAFGRGTLEVLRPENRKVFAFIRQYGDECILVVVNLSRNVQCVELDLSKFRGAVPMELFGNTAFPPIGDLPYFVTLGPHNFYWFSLNADSSASAPPHGAFEVRGSWDSLFVGPTRPALERFLPEYIARRRWFANKARRITSVRLHELIPITNGRERGQPPTAVLLLLQVHLDQGGPELYSLPVAFAEGPRADELSRWKPDAIIADLRAAGVDGVIYDAAYQPGFIESLVSLLDRRRSLAGQRGRIIGVPTPSFRRLGGALDPSTIGSPMSADQSNTSVPIGERAIVKLVRRLEEGINPGVELGRFLGEVASFEHAPRIGGSIEYRSSAPRSSPVTLAVMEEFVPNEGNGWEYVVDALSHTLEESLAHPEAPELRDAPPARLLGVDIERLEPGHILIGPHREWAILLGQRTAQLHAALSSEADDPAFAPEPLTDLDRRSLYHGARSLTRHVLRQVSSLKGETSNVSRVVDRGRAVLERLQTISSEPLDAVRIRCHGDFHLGQTLWSGRDFTIIDFEGEPSRSIARRRLKRPAAADLAGMIRSFHYAAMVAGQQVGRNLTSTSGEPANLDHWLTLWYRWVSVFYLNAYLQASHGAGFVPSDRSQFGHLLDFFLLEKAVYELSYEANSRPEWVDIPARGILEILDNPT